MCLCWGIFWVLKRKHLHPPAWFQNGSESDSINIQVCMRHFSDNSQELVRFIFTPSLSRSGYIYYAFYPWWIQWCSHSHLTNGLTLSPVLTTLPACSIGFCIDHGCFHGLFNPQPEMELRFAGTSFQLAYLIADPQPGSLLTSMPCAFLILTADWGSKCPVTHGGIYNCALNIGSGLWSSPTHRCVDSPQHIEVGRADITIPEMEPRIKRSSFDSWWNSPHCFLAKCGRMF